MGFGKSNALADEAQDDYVEEPFEAPLPSLATVPPAFERTGVAPGEGSNDGEIEFAPSLAPARPDDAGGAVMSLADPAAASLEARLGEAFAEQAEATLPAAAPVLPQPPSPRIQPPST
ncbi:hypothetical protein ACFPYM_23710, partial [Methylobacterium hispanicum]